MFHLIIAKDKFPGKNIMTLTNMIRCNMVQNSKDKKKTVENVNLSTDQKI